MDGLDNKKMWIVSKERDRAIDHCARNYVVAEQWLGTYQVTNDPRHLETARACYAIADSLYDQSFDQHADRDEARVQRILSKSRKRVSESFAVLAAASRVFDGD